MNENDQYTFDYLLDWLETPEGKKEFEDTMKQPEIYSARVRELFKLNPFEKRFIEPHCL